MWRRMGAVDHEVVGAALGINVGNRGGSGVPSGSRPSSSTVNDTATGDAGGPGGANDARPPRRYR